MIVSVAVLKELQRRASRKCTCFGNRCWSVPSVGSFRTIASRMCCLNGRRASRLDWQYFCLKHDDSTGHSTWITHLQHVEGLLYWAWSLGRKRSSSPVDYHLLSKNGHQILHWFRRFGQTALPSSRCQIGGEQKLEHLKYYTLLFNWSWMGNVFNLPVSFFLGEVRMKKEGDRQIEFEVFYKISLP